MNENGTGSDNYRENYRDGVQYSGRYTGISATTVRLSAEMAAQPNSTRWKRKRKPSSNLA